MQERSEIEAEYEALLDERDKQIERLKAELLASHAEAERLRAELQKRKDDFMQDVCWARGVDPEDACLVCSGLGARMYPTTAKWRKGRIAGQAFTRGLCDECWGSGDKHRKWDNIEKLQQALAEGK